MNIYCTLANSINLDENKLLSEFGYKYTPPKEGESQGKWNFNKKFGAQDVIDNIARVNQLTQVMENEGVLVRREKSLSGLKYSKNQVMVSKKAIEEIEAAYLQARDIEIAGGNAPAYAYGGKWVQKRRSALENMKIDAAIASIESEIKEGRKVVFFATRASDSFIAVPEGDEVQQKIAALVTNGVVEKTEIQVDDEGVEKMVKFYRQTDSTTKRIEGGSERTRYHF